MVGKLIREVTGHTADPKVGSRGGICERPPAATEPKRRQEGRARWLAPTARAAGSPRADGTHGQYRDGAREKPGRLPAWTESEHAASGQNDLNMERASLPLSPAKEDAAAGHTEAARVRAGPELQERERLTWAVAEGPGPVARDGWRARPVTSPGLTAAGLHCGDQRVVCAPPK